MALVGKALGAPDVMQLTTPALATLTVLGVAAATVGWVLIRRRRGGARGLRVLVLVVLLVSFVPDLLLGVSGTPWSALATLMCAHLAVFLVTIPVLVRMLPPADLARRPGPRTAPAGAASTPTSIGLKPSTDLQGAASTPTSIGLTPSTDR